MTGDNLSDIIIRGIFMKTLTNEVELRKHVFRNSTRLITYEKMRQEVMSALTAESRWGRSDGDWSRWQERQEGTDKKRRGKNDQKGLERAQVKRKAQEPRTLMRVLLLSPQGQRQKGMQNSHGRRKGHQEQG